MKKLHIKSIGCDTRLEVKSIDYGTWSSNFVTIKDLDGNIYKFAKRNIVYIKEST